MSKHHCNKRACGTLVGPSRNEASAPRWFVLQARHPILHYPVAEARFRVSDLNTLRLIIGTDADDDAKLRHSYELDGVDLRGIANQFGVQFDPGDHPVALMPWQSARDSPYLNRAGFELPLMLDGRKPFAKFSDAFPSGSLDQLLATFEPFVADGRIVRRIVRRPFTVARVGADGSIVEGIQEIYFSLPGQEWRIDANLLLFEVATRSGWNLSLERLEGMLLGYDDWQNDWHLARLQSRYASRPTAATDGPRVFETNPFPIGFEWKESAALTIDDGPPSIIEPERQSGLLDLLASWEPLDKELPDVD